MTEVIAMAWGDNEVLIREGLAGRNRDKLLRSVKFGGTRSGADGTGRQAGAR